MTPPKVSVIIPTYNRAHLLPRAINSVLNQTFQDFELIIVNDGSTDNTEDVVGSFKDESIIYIKHNKNKGPSTARNTGIKNSKGEYVAFLDSDDEWLPEKLEEQLKVFTESEDKNLGAVGGSLLFLEGGTTKTHPLPNFQKDALHKLLEKSLLENYSLLYNTNILIKREVFDEIGLFDENLFCGEDWDLGIRIAQKYNLIFIKRPLYKYYILQESICRRMNTQEYAGELFEYILQKYQNLYTKYPKIKGKILRKLGTLNLLSGNSKKAREYFIESIKISPTPRNILTFLLSLLGRKVYKKTLDIKRKLFLG